MIAAHSTDNRFRCLCALGAAGVLALFVRLVLAAPAAAPAVWVCGESQKVSPEMSPQERNGAWSNGHVRLYAGRGEYVGFQVVVRGGEHPLENVEVRLSGLRSADSKTLGAENIDRFVEHYLRVTVPSQWDTDAVVPEAHTGEFPVQMVPLREGFAVPAHRNQPVWIDVWIPEAQAPGEYAGTVQVLAAGKSLAAVPVQLTVWHFTLPRERHLKTYVPTGPEQLRWGFGLSPDDESALRRLEDRCFQMAHQHRLNFQPSEDEDVESEWGQRYRGYLDGSAFKERSGIGVGQNLAVLGTGGETKGEVQSYVRKSLAWWKRQKFPAELVGYVYDEPKDDEDYAAAIQRARWMREAVGKDLPLFLTTTQPGRIPAGLINVWGEIPPAEAAKRRASGDRIWAVNQGYAGGPFVDTPGYAARSQGWMAWKMGLEAWQFWDGCYWTDRHNRRDAAGKRYSTKVVNQNPAQFLTDTWNDPLTFDQKRNPKMKSWIRLNGDGCVFYPGRPAGIQEPLASFTMKSLRRGLQDYEYLWLLKQKGKDAMDLVDRVTPRPNEWAKSPEAWDEARLELGRRLDRLQ